MLVFAQDNDPNVGAYHFASFVLIRSSLAPNPVFLLNDTRQVKEQQIITPGGFLSNLRREAVPRAEAKE
jgi:hypothetical protein